MNWFKKHKILTGIIAFFLLVGIIAAASSGEDTKTPSSKSDTNSNSSQKAKTKKEQKPAARKVRGKTAKLGSGSFTGGKDLEVGLYDVTAAGQSGNFIVNGGSSYNEVLGGGGLGVDKVRATISEGDVIKISGLTSVTFTPVKAVFVTDHKAATLYAGTFVVGEDVGEGRYKVKPGGGQSGNFIVNGGSSYNEVLGSGGLGVPSLSVNLSNGDKITISGLNTVTFTPSK